MSCCRINLQFTIVVNPHRRHFPVGPYLALPNTMGSKLKRLFVIKTRWEAFAIIYALALGAVERGNVYLAHYPGVGGKLLFSCCMGAVFMGGAKILDAVNAKI